MRNVLTSKITIIVLALSLAFSAGLGLTVLAEELNSVWTGQDDLDDADAIVAQLIVTINDLDDQVTLLEADADDHADEIAALEAEIASLQGELLLANQAATDFKDGVCLQILNLPPRYVTDFDEWCTAQPGNYLPGTYTATVMATEYTSYSDELSTEVVIIVNDNGWITDVTFTANLIAGGTKDDPYAQWLNWDGQMEDVCSAIIAAQGWEPDDNIDTVSGATISIDGFELAFTTAIIDAIP